MYALAILTGIWFINRWRELNKTKNIRKYGWDSPTIIKDKERYTKLVSRMYFTQGVALICLGEFLILDSLYLNLPLEISTTVGIIVVVSLFIELILINKKRHKLTY